MKILYLNIIKEIKACSLNLKYEGLCNLQESIFYGGEWTVYGPQVFVRCGRSNVDKSLETNVYTDSDGRKIFLALEDTIAFYLTQQVHKKITKEERGDRVGKSLEDKIQSTCKRG